MPADEEFSLGNPEWEEGMWAAYQVRMDDGTMIWAPNDNNTCVRELARDHDPLVEGSSVKKPGRPPAGTVAKLLSLGADAALADLFGKTPLDYATVEEVKAALREHGGKHSLWHAAAEGMPEVVAELIKEGADAALTNAQGKTALMMACANGHEAAAAELME